jgi:hypothetical protein
MKCARSTAGECWASKTRPPTEAAYKEENHELVYPDSIYSGHSSSELLDGRYGGCRRYLDYLLIRRTLKRAVEFFDGPGRREAAVGHKPCLRKHPELSLAPGSL